jgi:hypothetical protein
VTLYVDHWQFTLLFFIDGLDDLLDQILLELFGLLWIINVSLEVIKELRSFWIFLINWLTYILESGHEVPMGASSQS